MSVHAPDGNWVVWELLQSMERTDLFFLDRFHGFVRQIANIYDLVS